MSEDAPSRAPPGRRSICLFCGSSETAPQAYLDAAADLGARLAHEGVRLVYGGGGVGLMGAAARAAHASGGEILGVMPAFLRRREGLFDEAPTRVVDNMHERKRIMFEQSDGFVVLPGGVGTLEEVVELLSWRRLDLHRKPIVFLDIDHFWRPFFDLIDATVAARLSPAWIVDTWARVAEVGEVLPALDRLSQTAHEGPGFDGYPKSASVTEYG